jgi:iron complex transport system substrate-binding protein
MKKSRLNFILLISAALLFASACGRPAAHSGGLDVREVTDDLGRRVVLPVEVTRVVSLAPNITEIIFAVGAGDKLVGVTSFCDYPEEAKRIQKIGDTLKPNIESIVALKPQVVFVTTASQLEAFSGVLKEQGISVFTTNPDSVESVFESMFAIGDVLGRAVEAGRVVSRLKARVGKVREEASRTTWEVPQTVFVQLDPTLYTVGKGSFITDLIAIAGGRSVTAGIEAAYPKVSKEAAAAYDPRVIILSDSPDNREPNKVFANSQAVKSGRIVRIDADVLSRPGPRIVSALELIFEGLLGRKTE